MKDEFKQVIIDWKNQQNFIETKNVWKMPNSIKLNEYLLHIEISAELKINSHKESITVSKHFCTLAQNDSTVNSNGDVYRLKILLDQLDTEFALKIEETINKNIDFSTTLNKEKI